MPDPTAIAPAAEAATDLAGALSSVGLGGLAALATAASVWIGRQLRPLEVRLDKLEALPERVDRLALRAEQAERELERLGARLDKIEAQATALADRVRESENAAVRAAVSTEHAIDRTVERIRQLRGELRALAAGGPPPLSGASPVDSRE